MNFVISVDRGLTAFSAAKIADNLWFLAQQTTWNLLVYITFFCLRLCSARSPASPFAATKSTMTWFQKNSSVIAADGEGNRLLVVKTNLIIDFTALKTLLNIIVVKSHIAMTLERSSTTRSSRLLSFFWAASQKRRLSASVGFVSNRMPACLGDDDDLLHLAPKTKPVFF